MLHEESKSFQSNPDVRNFSALDSNPAAQTHMVTCIVRLILPCRTLAQRNGWPGFVQTFIVVDTFAQRLNSDVWCYKIVARNEQAKKK